MQHERSSDWGEDKAAKFKTRLGLMLFISYAVFYGVFIGINAAAPAFMGRPSLGGLNLAIVYGFTLIFSAFLLGIVYHLICHLKEKSLSKKQGGEE